MRISCLAYLSRPTLHLAAGRFIEIGSRGAGNHEAVSAICEDLETFAKADDYLRTAST
jgi:hypothetical protein